LNIIDPLRDFITKAKNDSPEAKFSLGVATTAIPFRESFFSFPREIQDWGYYLHILCPSSDHATRVIKSLEGEIDSFFLDVEDKKTEFKAVEIKTDNPHIDFFNLYPNSLTVQSCFDFLKSNMEGRAFIFGHGDLAFRFAELMKQRGLNFSWRPSRMSTSSKFAKMIEKFPTEQRQFLSCQDDIFYNFSPFRSDFFINLEDHPNIKIVDVSAKAAFGDSFRNRIVGLDVSARLVNEVAFILRGNKYSDNYGRITNKAGVSFVSGGYPGNSGDLIVDSYLSPSFLIGISNGSGGFSQRINQAVKDNYIFRPSDK
jgi:hypothetical protein